MNMALEVEGEMCAACCVTSHLASLGLAALLLSCLYRGSLLEVLLTCKWERLLTCK